MYIYIYIQIIFLTKTYLPQNHSKRKNPQKHEYNFDQLIKVRSTQHQPIKGKHETPS